MDWTHEMSKMLSEFEHHAMQSLGVIKLAFRSNGLPFGSTFKEYFLRASTNRLSETFDRFEIKSKLEDKMLGESSDEVDEMERAYTFDEPTREVSERGHQNIPEPVGTDNWSRLFVSNDTVQQNIPTGRNSMETKNESSAAIQLDDSNDEKPIDGSNQSIVHQSSGNLSYVVDPEANSDLSFAMTNDESNNLIDIHSEELALKKLNRCTVCDYSSYHKGHFNRHMRTHTGEKPYGCDRCGKRFTRAQSLTKHAATHIAEFPFHCRACFGGFPLKVEAVAHEKQCRQRHFQCYLCNNFVTCFKLQLIKHMRKHTGAKPFRCEICMKRFTQKENIKRHLNNVHA